MLATTNRIINTLLGGAIGDALGAPIEFRKDGCEPEAILLQRDGFTNGLNQITDDTQMMLFTLEACLEHKRSGLDLITCCWDAYRRWHVTQTMSPDRFFEEVGGARGLQMDKSLWSQRAPGGTCLSALAGHKPGSITEPLNHSKGCGGVMRVAPIAFAGTDPFMDGCRSAALTHGHPDGYLPAGALCVILSRLVMGDHLDSAAVSAWHRLQAFTADATSRTGELITKALVMFNEGERDVGLLGEGWTGDEALAIGLLAALYGLREGTMEGYALAIAHGGDSDSTGLIAGTMMGAGGAELPPVLAETVEHTNLLRGLGGDLVRYLRGES